MPFQPQLWQRHRTRSASIRTDRHVSRLCLRWWLHCGQMVLWLPGLSFRSRISCFANKSCMVPQSLASTM